MLKLSVFFFKLGKFKKIDTFQLHCFPLEMCRLSAVNCERDSNYRDYLQECLSEEKRSSLSTNGVNAEVGRDCLPIFIRPPITESSQPTAILTRAI